MHACVVLPRIEIALETFAMFRRRIEHHHRHLDDVAVSGALQGHGLWHADGFKRHPSDNDGRGGTGEKRDGSGSRSTMSAGDGKTSS
jgi:hypothetical protein